MNMASYISHIEFKTPMTQENLSIPTGFVFQLEPAPSLAELFAVSDAIGDKYLDSDEISQRDAELAREIQAIAVLIEQDKVA
jgi:hypothetical protein